jgi:hypothetical protein
VNSLHLRFSRTRVDRGPASNLINPKDLGVNMNPLVDNFLDITTSGAFATGCGTCAPGFFNDNSYQVADDLDYVRGKHQLSFGGEYFRNQLNWLANTLSNGQFVFNGQFTGDSLADFLLGRISSVGRGGPLAISLRQNIMSFYAQDIWQARPNLTVTLGLRWEPLLPEADKNGMGVRFDRAAYVAGLKSQVYLNAPPGFFYYGDQGIPKSFANRDWNNLAPRIGLAWHPQSNTKTVVRASYGIFYQQPIMMYTERFSEVPPFGISLRCSIRLAGSRTAALASAYCSPFTMTLRELLVVLAPQRALFVQTASAPHIPLSAVSEFAPHIALFAESEVAPHIALAPHMALLPRRTEPLQVALAPQRALSEDRVFAPHIALSENTDDGSKERSTFPVAGS